MCCTGFKGGASRVFVSKHACRLLVWACLCLQVQLVLAKQWLRATARAAQGSFTIGAAQSLRPLLDGLGVRLLRRCTAARRTERLLAFGVWAEAFAGFGRVQLLR